MKPSRYLCIHGHFYQPPRENPWLEAVEVQDSAHPFHDWNERITMQCYGPNTAARISTWDGQILDIRNNYSKISFNFGPTLLSWLEDHRPEVYQDIIEADRISVKMRRGHGNALAQPFNHTILPLATEREKQIQVVWGLEDFRERFGRDPEGLWLPECAVDIASLECLAANGIRFTILAPRQAQQFRLLQPKVGEWATADGSRIDPTRPYHCALPSGRSIVLYFYDGPISQAIAFEGLLNDGQVFATRLMNGYSDARPWAQLLNIATDGESYGHHHVHGEMALAYMLHVVERDRLAVLMNYGEFLEAHPPEAEVRIWNNSSWSCVHGVERWKSDCGCNSGGRPGWKQNWRGPLREAFRFLADKAADVYDDMAPEYFENPGRALERYIHVLLHPKLEAFRRFLQEEGRPGVREGDNLEVLRLMEMMRNAHLIFTSCAWFFDEISGLEAVQNLKYGGRLIQLLQPFDPRVEEEFLKLLRKAPSNIPDIGDGAECYARFVKPHIVDLHRVIAHHVIKHFDEEAEGLHQLYCYEVRERDSQLSSFGNTRLKLCRVTALSLIDGESLESIAVVLHFGGHDFRCSIGGQKSHEGYEKLKNDLFTAYTKRSLTDLVRVVDEHFGLGYYSINHLFSEDRRLLLRRVTDDSFRRFDNSITMIYDENRKFMEYLLEVGAPLPRSFAAAAEFVLKNRLFEELEKFLQTSDASELMEIAREANRYGVRMNDPTVKRQLENTMNNIFLSLALHPMNGHCDLANHLLDVFDLLQLQPDLWEAQNIVFALVHNRRLPAHLASRTEGRANLPLDKVPSLVNLATRLRISLEPFEITAPSLEDSSRTSGERMIMKNSPGGIVPL